MSEKDYLRVRVSRKHSDLIEELESSSRPSEEAVYLMRLGLHYKKSVRDITSVAIAGSASAVSVPSSNKRSTRTKVVEDAPLTSFVGGAEYLRSNGMGDLSIFTQGPTAEMM